jgi:ATP-dependent Clp protease, protease subunit
MATRTPKRRAVGLDGSLDDDAVLRKYLKDNEAAIDSLSLTSIGVHLLFSEIDQESAKDACEFIIKANFALSTKTTLTLMINTPGGAVYDGWGIVDVMDCSRLKIQTVGIGAIFSMGAVIFTTGTPGKRVMTRNSYMMTHQFTDGMEAKYHEFVAQRPHQDELHNRFVRHFVERTKMTAKQVNDVLLSKSDAYLTAKDCLKFGICDAIKDPWD